MTLRHRRYRVRELTLSMGRGTIRVLGKVALYLESGTGMWRLDVYQSNGERVFRFLHADEMEIRTKLAMLASQLQAVCDDEEFWIRP